jgi:hypothetical protein
MMLWCASSSMTRPATGACAEIPAMDTMLAIVMTAATQMFGFKRIN